MNETKLKWICEEDEPSTHFGNLIVQKSYQIIFKVLFHCGCNIFEVLSQIWEAWNNPLCNSKKQKQLLGVLCIKLIPKFNYPL